MGMSASQARLIALTARMNDIEYQGQQINQQRTTLSNQVNALYNQLLEMSVPTPPSTSDYTKVQYSGISDASKFTLGNVVPTGKNESGDNTYNVQFSYKRSGHSVSKSVNSAQVTETKSEANFVQLKPSELPSLFKTETKATPGNNKITKKPETNDTKVMIAVTGAEYNNWLKNNSDKKSLVTVFGTDGSQVSTIPNDNTTIYIECKASDIDKFGGENGLIQSSENDGYTNVYEANEKEEYSYVNNADKLNFDSLKLYYYENGKSAKPIAITSSNYKEYLGSTSSEIEAKMKNIYQMNSTSTTGTTLPNPNAGETKYSVGDMPVYDLNSDTAKNKLGDSSYNEYLTALKNAFPNDYSSYTDEQLADIANDFSVYIEYKNGSTIPHFIKNTELSQINPTQSTVRPYDYTADGTYTQTETKQNCQLEFDASTGRITRVGIVNNGVISWIDVTAETVTDEDAYADAFNDYEYAKATYDKKQQEINAKTSIVQQQDKNLELKLTRLDNERNAVNTEMEAVKKVVSDNIEKSYKTFSG